MISRKINAITSLLATVLLLIHAISIAVWLFSNGAIAKAGSFVPWILFGVMLAHAFISIDLAISAHSETEKRKCNNYPKLNVPTLYQRISGILLILFTCLHVAGTVGILQPPKSVHAILPPLFFTIALMHAAISTGKAFITLGIGNAKLVKIINVAMMVICVATLVADVVGFYLYLC
jgi:hypothetical protein